MKIGAIVQARMSSQRFPGKVLFKVKGKPMLQYLLERLNNCSVLDDVVVATSIEISDTPIVDFCKEFYVRCYRGSLLNVADRFKEILDIYKFDIFVRVTADSPLLDQHLVYKGIEIFRKGNFEIVTNVLKRTYPKGQSVEVLKTDTFVRGYGLMQEHKDLEHLTEFFYRNQTNFRIFNFTSKEDYSAIRLCVDTAQDIDTISSIISHMEKPHWQYGLQDILKIYREIC